MGERQMVGLLRRDRVPFVLTPDMVKEVQKMAFIF